MTGCNNQELKDKGFTQCKSCNCGGVYSEKWSGYLGYRLKVVAGKFYLYQNNQLQQQGLTTQLTETLSEI